MPQVIGWGMGSGLHLDSDQGQEFEDCPSTDLNTHLTLRDTKEELLLPENFLIKKEKKEWSFWLLRMDGKEKTS